MLRLALPLLLALAACAHAPEDNLSPQVDALAHRLNEQGPHAGDKPRLAVVPFVDSSGHVLELSEYVADKLVGDLAGGSYDLVERSRMKQVMKELTLDAQGFMSDEQVASVGKVLGAQFLLIGSFTDLGESVEINARVVDVESARVATSANTAFRHTAAVSQLWKVMKKAPASVQANTPPPAQTSAPPPAAAPEEPSKEGWYNKERLLELGFELDSDRPGADFRHFDVDHPSKCKTACENDLRCRAFTVVKPGVFSPRARCFLKDRAPRPHASNCCVSGVR